MNSAGHKIENYRDFNLFPSYDFQTIKYALNTYNLGQKMDIFAEAFPKI